MGKFYIEAHIYVALLGVKDGDFKNHLSNQLTKKGTDDCGTCSVLSFSSQDECKKAVEENKVTAICIEVDEKTIAKTLPFIGYMRVAAPLVPFCLIGKKQFLDSLSGIPQPWKTKLSHYYKIQNDISEKSSWSENIGLVRDLFVADYVKCRALGNYETTPGELVRITMPKPYGFYRSIIFSAVIASILSPAGFILYRHLYETKYLPQTNSSQQVSSGSSVNSNR